MYTYNGYITRILDANTLEISVDLGFDLTIRRVFAIIGMKAPTFDLDPVAALAAKQKAIEMARNRPVHLIVHKIGRYGRYAAEITFNDSNEAYLEEWEKWTETRLQSQ